MKKADGKKSGLLMSGAQQTRRGDRNAKEYNAARKRGRIKPSNSSITGIPALFYPQRMIK
jgi:hypothetical protein